MGGLNRYLLFPPLISRKLWIIFCFLFAGVNQRWVSSHSPLSKMPRARCESGEHTLAGYRDRGFPRLPALPTPRGSDIRGSLGLIMQQAQLPANRRRGIRPLGGSRAALTLLKFIQAAGAAEGAHGGRLPAAASLHSRGGAASEQPDATWRRAQGLPRSRAQLGGPPGGGGGC